MQSALSHKALKAAWSIQKQRLATSSRQTNKQVIATDKTMKCQLLVFLSHFRDAEMAASIRSVLRVVVFAHIALFAHVPRALDMYL